MVKALSKIAAAAALAAAASSSQAYLVFEVSQFGGSGANPINLCNGNTLTGCGGGSGYTVGVDGLGNQTITFAGTVGDYFVSSTSTVSNSPGTDLFARVSTTALSVERISFAGGAGASLFIGVRAFNFAEPDNVLKSLVGSSGMSSPGGLGSGTITSTFWADAANAGAKNNEIGCSYPLTAAGSCTTPTIEWVDAPGTGGGLFSLRSEHSFRLAAGSLFEGTTSLIARGLPEPVSLSLVGLGLIGAAVASKRARKA